MHAVAQMAPAKTQPSPRQPAFANINPDWSPDGKRLVFQSERTGGTDIYIVEVKTGKVVRVMDDPAPDTHPSWSPDGKRITFDSARGNNWHIYVADADGKNVRRLTTDADAQNCSAGRHPQVVSGWEKDHF